MNNQHLDRVRDDLVTVKAAMGGLAYGPADVHFFIVASVAATIFAVSHALGARSGWTLLLAALPALLTAIVYACYLGVNCRRKSKLDETRRTEYRMGLLILVPALLVTLTARRWAALAGMSHLQFAGALGVVCGLCFVWAGTMNPLPNRYPRSTLFAVGFPLIAGGLVYPFCSRSEATIAVSIMGAVLFAWLAVALRIELRRQDTGTANGAS